MPNNYTLELTVHKVSLCGQSVCDEKKGRTFFLVVRLLFLAGSDLGFGFVSRPLKKLILTN